MARAADTRERLGASARTRLHVCTLWIAYGFCELSVFFSPPPLISMCVSVRVCVLCICYSQRIVSVSALVSLPLCFTELTAGSGSFFFLYPSPPPPPPPFFLLLLLLSFFSSSSLPPTGMDAGHVSQPVLQQTRQR